MRTREGYPVRRVYQPETQRLLVAYEIVLRAKRSKQKVDVSLDLPLGRFIRLQH